MRILFFLFHGPYVHYISQLFQLYIYRSFKLYLLFLSLRPFQALVTFPLEAFRAAKLCLAFFLFHPQ